MTLEENGYASFPDAPTQRGIKHMQELEKCMEDGYEAWLIFVIQMKGIHLFGPNWKTHPEFAQELYHAFQAGVNIQAWDCVVEKESIFIDQQIPIQYRQEI